VEAFRVIDEDGGRIGLKLNLTKCECSRPSEDPILRVQEAVQPCQGGLTIILGSLVGSDTYCGRVLSVKLNELVPLQQRLARFPDKQKGTQCFRSAILENLFKRFVWLIL
jgi:hypothetical protein